MVTGKIMISRPSRLLKKTRRWLLMIIMMQWVESFDAYQKAIKDGIIPQLWSLMNT